MLISIGDGVDKPSEYGEIYLVMYGILQVLIVQQDALEDLAELQQIPFELPGELREIRFIRVASVGHPSRIFSDKKILGAFISRPTLSRSGFQLQIASPGGEDHCNVHIPHLIEIQRECIANLLKSVIDHLTTDELEHRKKYRSKPLTGVFTSRLLDGFEKLRAGVTCFSHAQLAERGLNVIRDTVATFNQSLAERGIESGYYGIPPKLDPTQA